MPSLTTARSCSDVAGWSGLRPVLLLGAVAYVLGSAGGDLECAALTDPGRRAVRVYCT